MDKPYTDIILKYKTLSEEKKITNDTNYEKLDGIDTELNNIALKLNIPLIHLDTIHIKAVLDKYIGGEITEAQVIMVLSALNAEMGDKHTSQRHNQMYGIIDRLIDTVKKPKQGGRRKRNHKRTLRKHKRTLRKHKRTLRNHKRRTNKR
jgi:hypothetical protein